MKLSELVNYRTQLDAMSSLPIKTQAEIKLDQITHLIETKNIQLGDFAKQLQERKSAIQQSFNLFENSLTALQTELNDLIIATEKPWFQESYRLYEQEMLYETTEYILNRRPEINSETEQFYRTRIVRYNTWQHPTMIIRPGRETFVNELLASDPLYLVDESHDLLLPTLQLFNEQYQSRLRPYTINERQDQEILGKLPNDQFGLVFAYNFFNFRPFEVIRKYFNEIYHKLKPGGVLAMTFNDCDRDKGVMLVEQHFCCYTPGYLIRELAQSLGFEIVFSWTDEGPSTWLELRRPGQLHTLRGGQALAKILPKPIAKSK
jgi:SAM-dependent methyltransferase